MCFFFYFISWENHVSSVVNLTSLSGRKFKKNQHVMVVILVEERLKKAFVNEYSLIIRPNPHVGNDIYG